MSLFDELFADILTAQGESRPRSPAGRPAEGETPCGLSPESPRSPAPPDGKVAPAGDILTAQGENRPRSPAGRPAERETPCGLSPESPRSPAPPDEKVAPAGAGHGLDARRRFVLERLAADPALRVAWTCADDGADPLRPTLERRPRAPRPRRRPAHDAGEPFDDDLA